MADNARFLSGSQGYLYLIEGMPDDELKSSRQGRSNSAQPLGGSEAMLIVPPLLEELNCSRRFLSALRACLAERGVRSAQVDLFGTGDSQGELHETCWSVWCQDLESVVEYLRTGGIRKVHVLAVRAGALLVPELLQRFESRISRITLLQPVLDGAHWLRHMARLQVAAQMFSDDATTSATDLLSVVDRGEVLNLSGYDISASLVNSIRGARVEAIGGTASVAVTLLEVYPESRELSPVASQWLQRASAAGVKSDGCTVRGEPFWQTHEAELNLHLLDTLAQRFELDRAAT